MGAVVTKSAQINAASANKVDVIDVVRDLAAPQGVSQQFAPLDTNSSEVADHISQQQEKTRAKTSNATPLLSQIKEGIEKIDQFLEKHISVKRGLLTSSELDLVLADIRAPLVTIKETAHNVQSIIDSIKGKIVTEEQSRNIRENLSQLREAVSEFAGIAQKKRGVTYPAGDIGGLISAIEGLSESPAILPTTLKPKRPDSPIVSVQVPSERYDTSMADRFGPIDAFSDTSIFSSEEDYSRAWDKALAAKRHEEFLALSEQSKQSPLDVEEPRKELQGESVISHLGDRESQLVASITDAITGLREQNEEYSLATKRVDILSVKIDKPGDNYKTISSSCAEQQAAIQRLQDISDKPTAASTPTASPPAGKQAGLFTRLIRATTGRRKDVEAPVENRDVHKLSAESAAQSEKLAELRDALGKSQAEQDAINKKLTAAKEEELTAIRNRDDIGEAITKLEAKLSQAKKFLQDALRESCKNLHFTHPGNIESPIAEALLAISIPATKAKIPSLTSITDRLKELGATETADGGVCFTHPVTKNTIKIEKRGDHGLDATITALDADGNQIISDRIWNHNLKQVVKHFLRTGEAPLRPATIKEWQVLPQSVEAPDKTKSSDNASTVATRTQGIKEQVKFEFLKRWLAQSGYDVTAKKLTLTITNKVGEVANTITSSLDEKEWSLTAQNFSAAAHTTLEAFAKIVEYFSKSPVQASKEPSASLASDDAPVAVAPIAMSTSEKEIEQPVQATAKAAFGTAQIKHNRSQQQDRFYVSDFPTIDKKQAIKFFRDSSEAINQATKNIQGSGSTFTGALVTKEGDIVTAHLGDSPASVIVIDKEVNLVTAKLIFSGHTPGQAGESHRASDGTMYRDIMGFRYLLNPDGSKTKNSINLTQAYGDKDFGQALDREAEINQFDLQEHHDAGHRIFLLVTSDGAHKEGCKELHHQAHAAHIAKLLKEGKNLSEISQKIVELSSPHSSDNITVTLTEVTRDKGAIVSVFDGHGETAEVAVTAANILKQKIDEFRQENPQQK